MNIGFISLTKTGHTSITNTLPYYDFPDFSLRWLIDGKHQHLKNRGYLNDYDFLFSSVRHPVDRFVSSYQECCKTYGYQKTIHEFLEDYQEGHLCTLQMWHTQAQSFHLIKEDLDFIIRLENITEDIQELKDILKVSNNQPIPWINKCVSAKPQLDKKMIIKIEEEFSECMNQFNY